VGATGRCAADAPGGQRQIGQSVRVRLLLATASFFCLVAVGCTSDGAEEGGEPTVTEQQASSSTEARSPLFELRLSHDRLGPVQVGMTVEQAARALGENVIEVESGSGCATYRPVSTRHAIEFRLVDGRIIAIQAEGVETDAGVAVGDTEDAINQAYASETVANVSLPAVRRVLVRPTTDSGHATVFVLESGGTVSRIRVGAYPEVEQYEEGCP
jgi:hypothetical protein